MHNTVTYKTIGEIKGSKGLSFAINEFLKDHDEWYIEKEYENDHGLTILTRKESGKE